MTTTLIRNGRVIDPATGTDDRLDLVLQGERIVDRFPSASDAATGTGGCRVRDGLPSARRRDVPGTVIDATGMMVVPGFVDIHTHTDFTLPTHPQADARVKQGITTDVTGNCGFSPFPLPADRTDFGAFFGPALRSRWSGLSHYSAELADRGLAINVAPLVGLGAVRTMVMQDERHTPLRRDLRAMQKLVHTAIEQGAFGVSSGLSYTPGCHASEAELAEVLRPVHQAGGLYSTHLRDERDGLIEAVEEAIRTARGADVRLQISHHKALGRRNWGRTRDTLALIDKANEAVGDAVAFDYYPYTFGSTSLASLLPPGVLDEGWGAFRSSLVDHAVRQRVLDHLRRSAQFRLDEVFLGQSVSRPDVSGRSLSGIARDDGADAASVALNLLLAEGERITIMASAASRDDLDRVAAHPQAMHGSDAWLLTADQARHEHDRHLHSAMSVLVPAMSDRASLARALMQLASAPAKRLKLADRGSLRPGAYADIVILDPTALQTDGIGAQAGDSEMVRTVFVNGSAVLSGGQFTDCRPGRVLSAI